MDYDRFIGLVQNRARLATTADAVTAIRATLETIAERIGANEARHLASQLPREIGHYLQEGPPAEGERFSFDEFCRRVAERENFDRPEAVFHARCVIETLEEAVTPGEVRHVLSTLPDDFTPLFAAGHKGQLSDYASISHEDITRRAHEIWERSGRPAGQELEHWLTAERELRQEREKSDPNTEIQRNGKHTSVSQKRQRTTKR